MSEQPDKIAEKYSRLIQREPHDDEAAEIVLSAMQHAVQVDRG